MTGFIGKTVSHYRILTHLGEGGMGVVYKAEDLKLQRFAALKFLPAELTRDPEANRRFFQEARAASALDHQNVCTIYEIDEMKGDSGNGRLFIAMAYYEGETLQSKIANGRLPIEQAVDFTRQIAAGLGKAHTAGIVHRDIKPSNIIITEDGVAKILDFGIAKLAGQTRLTRTGSTIGTALYMSPEQARNETVDHRSDIWSLGVLLFEMLAGRTPFEGDYELAVMYAVMNETPPPLAQFRPEAPKPLQHIIDNALAKSPETRYQKMQDFRRDLRIVRKGGSTVTPPPRQSPTAKPVFKKASFFGAAAAILLLSFFLFKDFFAGADSPESTVSPNRVAVMPFSVFGGEDVDFLGGGMIDLLSIRLDGAGDLRRVDPSALKTYIAREIEGEINPENAGSIAEHFGAGLYVLGNVYENGEKLQVTASLYDVREGLKHAIQTNYLDKNQLFQLADETARKLLSASPKISGQISVAQLTSSIPALKAYLQGEAFAREGKYNEAIEAFQTATREDSTFAMAYYKMAVNDIFAPSKMIDHKAALQKALRYRKTLSDWEINLFTAYSHYYNAGRLRQAEQLLLQVVIEYPNNLDAWLLLGVMRTLFCSRQGRYMDEARLALENCLKLNPDQDIALGFLQMTESQAENFRQMEIVTEKRLKLAPHSQFSRLDRTFLAHMRNDPAAKKEMFEEMKHADGFHVFGASLGSVRFHNDYAASLKLAELLLEPAREPFWRSQGYRALACINLRRGHRKTAMADYASGEKEFINWLYLDGSIFLLTPLMEADEAVLRGRIKSAITLGKEKILWPARVQYTAGMLSAHLGEAETAALYADSLLALANDIVIAEKDSLSLNAAQTRFLGHTIYARLFFQQGDFEKAWDWLEQSKASKWMDAFTIRQTTVAERYLRARILKALGRFEDAIRWLSTVGSNGVEIFYKPQRHYLLGEIYEETGEPQKAVENYTIFTDLWKDCDPDLRPVVEEVKQRIALLEEM